ncbi:glycerol-3-phosphate dehydrogenase [Jannaschia pagri]|uniref:Glycerol-3-phosphate dehydrogenase n=1 Tax=Jannaschia pagri TaxID=2829797 RepID=A0ABQ4NQN2_9RHOB|nr:MULTISPECIES: FAD-dependent oxidoreductase [unclassified Jannaschia]GIT92857.1 glycerol-3-phosphate dehydrogenase [Jannaschia sp. AI_61]GIT96692.1 glycerol-3-phosphate dehydrogenase [Jannaschia sp. AI_62]
MDTDFLVIGGGIAGTSAGAALSTLGQVVLWEAEPQLGYHASGRSAAMFEEGYGPPSVVALNRASRATHAAHGDLTPRGFLAIALPGEEAQFDRDLAALGLSEVSPDEARGLVPILSPDVARAAHQPDACDLDTDAMLQRAIRVIRASGGRVETDHAVTSLTPIPGGWRALSGDRAVTARLVFNAAGAWADAVARLACVAPVGLRPLRRSVARIAAPDGHDVSPWPMVMGAGETWYAKPDAGALIVSPADQTASDPCDAFADDMDLAIGLDRYAQAVTVPPTRPLANWAGLRTFAPDGTFVLGPSQQSGFWWVAGQGGYGFQTAPAASELLADMVAGRPPQIAPEAVAALDPGRFA